MFTEDERDSDASNIDAILIITLIEYIDCMELLTKLNYLSV